MPENITLREKYLALCKAINKLAKTYREEHRSALHDFTTALGRENNSIHVQDSIPGTIAGSPTVQTSLATVRDLLQHGPSNNGKVWGERICEVARHLREGIEAVPSNPWDDKAAPHSPLLETLRTGGTAEEPTIKLTATMKKILSVCRRKHYKGQVLADKVHLSFDYARSLFAKLVKAGKLKNDPEKGYRTA